MKGFTQDMADELLEEIDTLLYSLIEPEALAPPAEHRYDGRIADSLPGYVFGRKEPPEPPPVELHEGDWAWLMNPDGSDGKLVRLFAPVCGDPGFWWLYDNLACVRDKALRIPTRDQLAVTIPGTDVQAWAWESAEYPELVYRYRSDHINSMIRRDEAEALGLHIVSASQVERHYGGVFPPKEE